MEKYTFTGNVKKFKGFQELEMKKPKKAWLG